ncbi:hypothetical protein D1007_29034 [Hordeum vulgare]|nr:hypothetical protein D1007_29034 [Hordeum vulgare]
MLSSVGLIGRSEDRAARSAGPGMGRSTGGSGQGWSAGRRPGHGVLHDAGKREGTAVARAGRPSGAMANVQAAGLPILLSPPRPYQHSPQENHGGHGHHCEQRGLYHQALKNKAGGMPIAKMAEKPMCRRLGIITDNGHLTEEAIGKFAALFHGRLPAIAIDALRALFLLDCDLGMRVEEALVAHGGEGAMEHAGAEDASRARLLCDIVGVVAHV